MGSFYMEATQINYRRDAVLKTVDQKLQELSEESAIDTDIAPVFKSTNTYAPGDMVYYRNKLYTFNVEHSGAWAVGDVTATNVTTAIKNAAAVKADEADIAPAFDTAASYSAGDLVYYGGIIYRCTNDHTGDWDADDFSATTISAELASLKSGLTNYQTQNDLNLEVPDRKNVGYFDLEHAKKASIAGVWSGNQYTVLGITYTVITDSNGSVTEIKASGTSMGDAALRFSQRSNYPVNLQTGSYIVSGGNNASAYVLVGRTYNGGWQEIARSGSSESSAFNVDISDNLGISINVDPGATVEDISFYPMIRPATITDATFAPYIPSVESRLETVESGLGDLSDLETTTKTSMVSAVNEVNTGLTGKQNVDRQLSILPNSTVDITLFAYNSVEINLFNPSMHETLYVYVGGSGIDRVDGASAFTTSVSGKILTITNPYNTNVRVFIKTF